jgi:hypothetical protein
MPNRQDYDPRVVLAANTLAQAVSHGVAAVAGGGGNSSLQPKGTPTISAVSGVLANNNVITISGAGFGEKATAAPLEFQRFEGTANAPVETEIPSWPGYRYNGLGSDGSILSSERSHSGATSAMNRMPEMGQFATNYHKYTPSDNVFASYWLYIEMVSTDEYRDDSLTTQIKLARVTSDTDAGGGGVYNGTPTDNGGTWRWSPVYAYTAAIGSGTSVNGPLGIDAGVTYPMETEGATGGSRYVSAPINKWTRIDYWVQNSSAPGVADGVFGFSIPGIANREYGGLVTVEEGKSHQQNAFILGNMIANFVSPLGNSLAIFTDDVYIDNTRAKVEIGDNPDYYDCTRLDICPATSWGANSVTVALNSDAVPAGTNYIFVMNSSGAPSAGHEVSI